MISPRPFPFFSYFLDSGQAVPLEHSPYGFLSTDLTTRPLTVHAPSNNSGPGMLHQSSPAVAGNEDARPAKRRRLDFTARDGCGTWTSAEAWPEAMRGGGLQPNSIEWPLAQAISYSDSVVANLTAESSSCVEEKDTIDDTAASVAVDEKAVICFGMVGLSMTSVYCMTSV